METVKEFIKPELLILIPVLYFIGTGIKKSEIKDKRIPLLLGICGVVLSILWVFADSAIGGIQSVLLALFTAVTQGVLCAGASVFFHQLMKQQGKE